MADTKRHDELMKLTKEQLTDLVIGHERGAKEAYGEREVRITSPAGPVHIFHGFMDNGKGGIIISGLPEDEIGHWAPYYALSVNGQTLEGPVIEHGT